VNLFPIRMLRTTAAIAAIWLPVTTVSAQTATARIVRAANTFLSTLTEKQRQTVLFAFDDEQQRARWSNFPTGFIPRGGISLKEMNPAQRSAAMALVAAALSPKGFEKVQHIMEGDEVLRKTDNGPGGPPGGNRGYRPPPGGGPPPGNGPPPGGGNRPPMGDGQMFGKDLYYISILGTPSEKTPWMLQFGGHHLALNITIAGERGILTPTLTGAQPALYTIDGKTVRPLGPESDKGFALLQALDDKQRKQGNLQLPARRSCPRPGAGRQDNCSGRLESFRND